MQFRFNEESGRLLGIHLDSIWTVAICACQNLHQNADLLMKYFTPQSSQLGRYKNFERFLFLLHRSLSVRIPRPPVLQLLYSSYAPRLASSSDPFPGIILDKIVERPQLRIQIRNIAVDICLSFDGGCELGRCRWSHRFLCQNR